MRHLLLFVHLLGFIMWMGGGYAALSLGMLMRRLPRNELAMPVMMQGRLMRELILPGAVLATITGIMLTLSLYGSATSVQGYPGGLMAMQGAGMLGAVLVLIVGVPTGARIARLDPVGEHAPLFDALQRKAAVTGVISGALALIALIGGVLMR
ncbi:MAG TPA: hypothetical protein VF187_07840 [Gemmatimonadales bacterium]